MQIARDGKWWRRVLVLTASPAVLGGLRPAAAAGPVKVLLVTGDLKLRLPPAAKDRMLPVSEANGEGFQVVKTGVTVSAGQQAVSTTLEMKPLTALSVIVAPAP